MAFRCCAQTSWVSTDFAGHLARYRCVATLDCLRRGLPSRTSSAPPLLASGLQAPHSPGLVAYERRTRPEGSGEVSCRLHSCVRIDSRPPAFALLSTSTRSVFYARLGSLCGGPWHSGLRVRTSVPAACAKSSVGGLEAALQRLQAPCPSLHPRRAYTVLRRVQKARADPLDTFQQRRRAFSRLKHASGTFAPGGRPARS